MAKRQKEKYEPLIPIINEWLEYCYHNDFKQSPLPPPMLQKIRNHFAKLPNKPLRRFHSPQCHAFEAVMKWAAKRHHDKFMCFLLVFLPEFRHIPIKTLAHDLKLNSDSVYLRANKAAEHYIELIDFKTN